MQSSNQKIPYYFHHPENKVLALGGIWSHWEADGHSIDSCSIITTEVNDLIKNYHSRMPLILSEEHYQAWISKDLQYTEPAINKLLISVELEIHRVTLQVNRASYNQPTCIDPI